MKKLIKNKIFKLFSIIALVTVISGNAVNAIAPRENFGSPQLRGLYASPNNIKLEGEVSLNKGNQIISVSLRDSDVKQVLRMFADKAGLNIIFHKSVEGKITLDLVNTTLNDAFRMIMQMSELSFIINNDTLMVMSKDAAKELGVSKENMSIIPVKYIKASDIATFLNKNIFTGNTPGLSSNEIVVTNPVRNELLIFGSDNDYKLAKKIVDKFDVKPQVTTYKVNHTTPKEMAFLLCQALFPDVKMGDAVAESAAGDDDKISSITLGGGVVACRSENTSDSNQFKSLGANNLTVVYQPSLGAISLYGGSSEQVMMVNDFIATNDRKQPQAYIDVSFVELSEEGSKNFQNNWVIQSNDLAAGFSGATGLSIGPLYYRGSGAPVNAGSISQTVSYLIESKKGKLLANPKVMVTNGKASSIKLAEDYVEKVEGQVLQSASGVSSATQKTYTIGKDMGIQLDMVPFISPDGYVSLNLKPHYATKKSDIIDKQYNDALVGTLLNRRDLNLSNIRIKDGETLVIGGLIKEEEQQNVTKIPILGDIPVAGVFFRNTKKTNIKSELVILITPRIIKDTEDVVRL